ncbi:XRE family transcriptional regulator [Candidatus Roizmanbacteria bacterium CG_4_10_14_0_2_um_filter_36_35]|uniref:XRE family transcriptional regulator n=4 Tax=Candidatus Roizmaniibacteriota TaxID=1752723 RepID=A0A2M7BW59_9BACT|nr:MAG: transcriptional regulator [Candidatus Roizmanbacteria bacterium CG11_big_fil_rev_8_21_14_0_20_35_14]PIV10798.1 MAG: XRE family transcriptional regulator [Candidatus Roizmanbacteria bacterium CG03_land_8_20_14_0_80_35_26]PIZ68336.1 MAG: XRE family transcriptional regulator [Candidatus Roizmanbacteria bacterium CG_4_10_14_0_2_um_filter_36_35]PJC32467.1 MAG: XRE family transcriptional regulator [Candidatus Roizmanbacteria bacterium CG_4_9_14_0_2_um_filter_36_12]PJC80069.1 MAG: XRE family t
MKYKYICGRLGKEILRIRKVKNLSQDDLAVDCNIDRSYLAEVEEGKANPSLKILCKISEGLNIQLYQLFVNL